MSNLKSISAWSEQQRLIFVERLLYWRGSINRKDLCEHFGISMPQATKDLVAYTSMNSGACSYDVRQKCYVASARMRTVFQQADFGEAMHDMASAMMKDEGEGEFILGMTRPQRTANLAIFRKLSLAAYRNESVEASYWSIRSGASVSRRMSPRAFGYDGLRWHVRAFCHNKEQFLDFVIGRFESVGKAEPSPFSDRVDSDWIENVDLQLRPNPDLDAGKQRALEMDYGMEDGQCILTVRKAMKLYTLRRLGFVGESMAPPMVNE
ncbi:MAG TPA: hypothetical protein DEA90_03245, partial [Opitutae bacterium]|nr:hypothetical protein [Opitutae bacterium]